MCGCAALGDGKPLVSETAFRPVATSTCTMSGKLKQRSSANAAETATVSVNEKILKECHTLYTESEKGWYYYIRVDLFILTC